MRRITQVVIALLVIGMAAPSSAFAHVGWWDWIEELSGPGPFRNGWMFDFRPVCSVRISELEHTSSEHVGSFSLGAIRRQPLSTTDAGADAINSNVACTNNREVRTNDGKRTYSIASYLEFRGGGASSASGPLFADRPTELVGKSTARVLQVFGMGQVHPAVAVGMGAGVLSLTGTHVVHTQNRFLFTPVAVTVMPFRFFLPASYKRTGALAIRFDEMAIRGRLRAQDFNPASTSSFETKGVDWIRSLGVTVDVFALIE